MAFPAAARARSVSHIVLGSRHSAAGVTTDCHACPRGSPEPPQQVGRLGGMRLRQHGGRHRGTANTDETEQLWLLIKAPESQTLITDRHGRRVDAQRYWVSPGPVTARPPSDVAIWLRPPEVQDRIHQAPLPRRGTRAARNDSVSAPCYSIYERHRRSVVGGGSRRSGSQAISSGPTQTYSSPTSTGSGGSPNRRCHMSPTSSANSMSARTSPASAMYTTPTG
jgi:hypothetical protein